ncbi:MAG: hypothetical protein WED00_18340 [Aquisalimonadaceae bacterium]
MVDSLSLANVIDSEFRLAVLETEQPERLFEVFKRLTLTTGRAVYGWSPNDGLYRLGTERIFIPQTRSIGDALSYIAASRHYGIYLLRDMGASLQKPSILRALDRILTKNDNTRRLVIMLDAEVGVPEDLKDFVVRIRHSVQGKELSNR